MKKLSKHMCIYKHSPQVTYFCSGSSHQQILLHSEMCLSLSKNSCMFQTCMPYLCRTSKFAFHFLLLQSQFKPQISNTMSFLAKKGLILTHSSVKIEDRRMAQTKMMVGTPSCFPMTPLRKG